MAKATWYQNLTQMVAGMTSGFTAAFNAIFPGVQSEVELRESLFTGFYEPLAAGAGLVITGNGAANAAVNLSWPQGKGAILAGVRIASPAQWVFAAQAAGEYDLCLDNTCAPQIVLSSAPNSTYLIVATVGWTLSTLTLSGLAPTALAQNSGLTITGLGSGGGAGTVTQVNGVNPDGSGHVTLTPANVGAEAALGNPATLTGILQSTEAGARSWVQLAWNMLMNIPSAFTPAVHASTHGTSGSDPVSPASIGAVASAAIVQSVGDPGSGSNVPSEAAVNSAIAAAMSGSANGLTYKGLWNAGTNSPAIASSTGTLGWFYKVSVAGSTTVDGNNVWQVGDIIIFDGSKWDRIAGYEAVSSVFGRTGPVTAQTGDYSAAQVGAEPALGTPGAGNLVLTSSTTGTRSWAQVAWSWISGIPSSFTPSAHAGTHGVSGSDPVALDVAQVSAFASPPAGSGWSSLPGALSSIWSTLSGLSSAISSTVSSAVTSALSALSSSNIANSSGVAGVHVTDALNTLYSTLSTVPLNIAAIAATASTSPPASPSAGEFVLVNGTGSGAFAGFANSLVQYSGSAWSSITSWTTQTVYVLALDTGDVWQLSGGAWGTVGVQCGQLATYNDTTYEYVALMSGRQWVVQLTGVPAQFSTFPAKTSPVNADLVLIEDSAASWAKKYATLAEIVALASGGSSINLAKNLLINGGFDICQKPRTANPGTIYVAFGTPTTVTGTGTNFNSYDVGGMIYINGGAPGWYLITAVASATSLTISASATSCTAGTSYTIAQAAASGSYQWDQWYVLTQTGNVAVQQVASGLNSTLNAGRILQANATAQRVAFGQIIESFDVAPCVGQTITCQAQVRSSVGSAVVHMALLAWSGTADAPTKNVVNSWTNGTFTAGQFFNSTNLTVLGVSSLTLSGTAETYGLLSVSGTPTSGCSNLMVLVWTDAALAQGGTLDVTQADLFVGSATRTWQGVDIAGEMARCLRHLVAIPAVEKSVSCSNASAINVNYTFPTAMRATPMLNCPYTQSTYNTSVATGEWSFCVPYSGSSVTISSGTMSVNYSLVTPFEFQLQWHGMAMSSAGISCLNVNPFDPNFTIFASAQMGV